MSAAAFQKRPYQTQLETETLNAISTQSGKNSVLALSPTGSGKTVVGGSITYRCANQAGYNVLFLAHRTELVEQAQDRFLTQYGIRSGVIKAGVKPNYNYRVQIGSIQSYIGRIGKIPFEPKVIIIDECHHCAATTYKNILKAHPNAKKIGLTATPYRLDGQGLNDIFETMVSSVTIKELEDMGFLNPADCYSYPMDKENLLSELKNAQRKESEQAKYEHRSEKTVKLIDKGDYDQNIVGAAMSDYQTLADMVESYRQQADGKTAICFASTIAQSQLIVDYFNQCGISSRHVDGESKNRKAIFDALDKGIIKMVSNVNIATEGVDIPSIECVMLARKTKSLSLYLQMVGRGSRLFTRRDGSKKTDYKCLDFCDNIFEHGLPNADIDWEEHFTGAYKKKKAKKKKEQEEGQQFEMKLQDGSTFIGTIDDIPKGMKGISLVRIIDNSSLNIVEKKIFQEKFDYYLNSARASDYKPISAYYKWSTWLEGKVGKNKIPTIQDFLYVGSKLNYSSYWAECKYKEFMQKIQSRYENSIGLR